MTTATAAEGYAKGMGAYVGSKYGPGLELGRGGLSSGSIALHDAGVPGRLAGLGARLAKSSSQPIQKSRWVRPVPLHSLYAAHLDLPARQPCSSPQLRSQSMR